MKLRLPLFGALIAVCLATSSAPAAVVYEVFFSVGGVSQIDSTIAATPGETITGASIFLRETVTDTTAPVLGGGTLATFAVDILSNGPAGSVLNAANAGFPASGISDSNTIGSLIVLGAPSTTLGGGVSEILLGTVDLVAPGVGETYVFSLADPQPTVANFNFGNAFANTPIPGGDAGIQFRSLTVTAIPEPSSIAAIAALGAFGAFRLRRKRKLAKTAAV